MIGVATHAADHDVVREFFELFKTPWELCRRGHRYDVLLISGDADHRDVMARVTIMYAADKTAVDEDCNTEIQSSSSNTLLSYGAERIPVYGKTVAFARDGLGLTLGSAPQPAAYRHSAGGRHVIRVGYELFSEIRTLLTENQPVAHAAIPTLEMHISVLRDLITAAGLPLVEIPSVPVGGKFIACLTHDVDHASLRRHTWDHTALGFLYRAVLGSLINLVRGRASIRDLLRNWGAATRLPLVYMGLVQDFWRQLHRYLELDPPVSSTFFVIPFKDRPGRTLDGPAPPWRAARYEARDIAADIEKLRSAGCEIGVHGLDAWLDSARGCEELSAIAQLTGVPDPGVRMHWLYTAPHSPSLLEKAGFAYDSTSGYNETVGYRAGTTQVFKPLDAVRLLELPLHIMDTALFYPSHLNLPPREALTRIRAIIDNAARFGGIVTINWHDRSIAPERLWRQPYADVVAALKEANAWFATASQAVAWFRQRRTVAFESVIWQPGLVRVRACFDRNTAVPGLRLRVHRARPHAAPPRPNAAADHYIDADLNVGRDTCVCV
jgi:hypothetical protein